MRLIGKPGGVQALVDALRNELDDDPPILTDISPAYPTRGNSGTVRIYLRFDGTRLAAELTST